MRKRASTMGMSLTVGWLREWLGVRRTSSKVNHKPMSMPSMPSVDKVCEDAQSIPKRPLPYLMGGCAGGAGSRGTGRLVPVPSPTGVQRGLRLANEVSRGLAWLDGWICILFLTVFGVLRFEVFFGEWIQQGMGPLVSGQTAFSGELPPRLRIQSTSVEDIQVQAYKYYAGFLEFILHKQEAKSFNPCSRLRYAMTRANLVGGISFHTEGDREKLPASSGRSEQVTARCFIAHIKYPYPYPYPGLHTVVLWLSNSESLFSQTTNISQRQPLSFSYFSHPFIKLDQSLASFVLARPSPNRQAQVLPSLAFEFADNMVFNQFHGLRWVQHGWDSYADWAVDLDPDAIRQTVGSMLRFQGPCKISYIDEGAFNQVWHVDDGCREAIARITLPVNPTWKTLSEVATLNWIRNNTSLPAPRILAYHAGRDNPIGFEWVAMTKLPGRPLFKVWPHTCYGAKLKLVEQIAHFASECFRHQLSGVGSLFPRSRPAVRYLTPPPESQHGSSSATSPALPHSHSQPQSQSQSQPQPQHFIEDWDAASQIGALVTSDFIWDDRFHDNVPRGPFSTSREWVSVQLTLVERSVRRRMAREIPAGEEAFKKFSKANEDIVNEFDCTLSIIHRLWSYLDDLLPPARDSRPEPSMIMHDMSRHNILLHEDGALSGVVDWDCTPALPLWMTCQPPGFLHGPTVHVPPEPISYRNGHTDKNYLRHWQDFELTVLRSHFLNTMRMQEPGWARVYEASQKLRDFELAVDYCDQTVVKHIIEQWLNDLDRGVNFPTLEERIDNSWPYYRRHNHHNTRTAAVSSN
ncbi:hypothetical protein BGZ63DRAFT_401266 [Mariannaea sp. PMI_226]|nr:hypothetical protein BGZ63DRAFT_401266 [Mariannaea sp. PMI_226]